MRDWFKKKITSRASEVLPASGPFPPAGVQSAKRQGDEHVRAGRLAEAERCYLEAVESDVDRSNALVMLGFVLRQQGRLDEARTVLERAIALAESDADAHYLLGSILTATGVLDVGTVHLERAIQLRPAFSLARSQLISALRQSDQWARATETCETGLLLEPNSSELHVDRSDLYLHANDIASAIRSCTEALKLDVHAIPAQQRLSGLLYKAEMLLDAEESYRREIELTPEHFGPHHMLGVVLTRLGRPEEAVRSLQRAIALNPGSSDSYASLASIYADMDDTSEQNLSFAIHNFEKAAELRADTADVHYSLGLIYCRAGQYTGALRSFDRAVEINPAGSQARWARTMLWAPPFSDDQAPQIPRRAEFGAELSKFERWWATAGDDSVFVGELLPFYLTYQEQDNLDLLKQYGRVCAQAMERWLSCQPPPSCRQAATNLIRVGIVSADIRTHSIWMALVKGWLQSFNRDRFEVVVFSLAGRMDAETDFARSAADVFIHGSRDLAQWVAAIRAQNCQLLVYPAVGLDPLTVRLACLRLAQVQITSWGHPDTSGLPTLDYYVSAECFEPRGAQEYYSEKLILLPNLGSRIQPMNLAPCDVDLAALGIDVQRPMLICPGTPYKYQPEHDHVLAEIAVRRPDVQLLFFVRSGSLADTLQQRIARAFASLGLRVSDHVRFVRWLSLPEFHHLLRQADAMLDTIGFSGYNTAVQAMECGLPLVTREGRFLRGRLASGVLRRMDLGELIVQTKADYVNLAVRLLADREYRTLIRQRIEQRRSVLFDDRASMDAFQDFLEEAALGSSGPVR